METKDLNKNISDILKSRYVVPLYQRNYAWGQEEISQLLQDVYENFTKDSKSNYYIGSLVVLERKNGDFEVIDGQQRLTTITLIGKVLKNNDIKVASLCYDSRPEVENFFNALYRYQSMEGITYHSRTSHLYEALGYIKNAQLNPDSEIEKSIANLSEQELSDFRDYFFDKVILVRVEIPEDTDVAKYFEIMNNRGEQLKKHEVLKAKLLSKIGVDQEQQDVFALIWDTCSQMDVQIQKLFSLEQRKQFFGDDFNSFQFDSEEMEYSEVEADGSKENTIGFILSQRTDEKSNKGAGKIGEDVEDEAEDSSIIDFPNFLMHVLKLENNKKYLKKTGKDIPLNEKYLLEVYQVLENEIKPMYFAECLLFYRTVFDRFVIKATTKEDSEDNYEWTLRKPNRYYYEAKKHYKFNYLNTFNDQDRLIKSMSMLQVTFRTRIYKNWLQDLLSWFTSYKDLKMSSDHLQKKIDTWMLDYYNQHERLNGIGKTKLYSDGTNTPHFLFNFIDYLYYLDNPRKYSSLSFKYRNSVEHHRPQSRPREVGNDVINCLGNLCLVSKGHNSKMNNEEPNGKAVTYYDEHLTPKRKVMYDLTNKSTTETKWAEEEILAHYDSVVDLLGKKEYLLQV
ncbi:DUF262 domain-containing protein [Pedobacter sp. KBW06]|uniref:DUF262 domain-containing protein n=1 Tax=Pedobacter sp. KBW06 TaxID=2153359 RepID=UPI000F59AEB4|nr:DUF262 domain-containing protein [Pedobacter sp. KBW06]RQO66452.1 DUF262 domain-containing protein [Pedobacter sp. KBW06]